MKSNTAEGSDSCLLIVNGHTQTGQQQSVWSVYQGVVTEEDILSEIRQSYWWTVWKQSCSAVFDNTPTSYVATRLRKLVILTDTFRGIPQSTTVPVGLTVNHLNPFLLGPF